MKNLLIATRQFVLFLAEPFLKTIGSITFGKEGILVSDEFSQLRDGDSIVSRRDWTVSNLFISGYWKHVGIVKVEASGIFIIEAIGKTGVSKTKIEKFLETKTQIEVFRSRFADADQAKQAAEVAQDLIGLPYDFGIISGNEAFYCSEVIWYSYDKVLNPSPFEPRETMGIKTITPNDIAQATKKWLSLFKETRSA